MLLPKATLMSMIQAAMETMLKSVIKRPMLETMWKPMTGAATDYYGQ